MTNEQLAVYLESIQHVYNEYLNAMHTKLESKNININEFGFMYSFKDEFLGDMINNLDPKRKLFSFSEKKKFSEIYNHCVIEGLIKNKERE